MSGTTGTTTIAEQILARITNLENQIADLQMAGPPTGPDTPIPPTESLRGINETIAQLRQKIDSLESGSGFSGPSIDRAMMNNKEMMPDTLGNDYRDKWRRWSYKTKDYLSLWHTELKTYMEQVESMKHELTPEFISGLNIPERADTAMRRFLVHKLDGDPAEIVQTKAHLPGIEQYRTLAQLCDPTAGGRNWSDAQHLYYPSPAGSLQALPAKIAEWKNLESRCKARSGEKVPPTLRNIALLNLCPSNLKDKLNEQPDVAAGRLTFEELENLILMAVHSRWDKKTGLNNVEPVPQQHGDDLQFEMGGELYELRMVNGKRTPSKINRPGGTNSKGFKGKCFRCDRTGHRSGDCKFSKKADGSALNPKRDKNTTTTPANNVEQESEPVVDAKSLEAMDDFPTSSTLPL